MLLKLLVPILACCLILTACGASDSSTTAQEQIKETVASFTHAAAKNDAVAFCDNVTADTQAFFEKVSQTSTCPAAATKVIKMITPVNIRQTLRDLNDAKITVTGTTATITFPHKTSQSPHDLQQVGNRWLIVVKH